MKLYNALVVAWLLLGTAYAQHSNSDTMQSCPMHKEHVAAANPHHALVNKNGDQAMGFPHDATTHHFRIYADGGAIEVTANDPMDKTNTGAIRSHLTHIAAMFKEGNFAIPYVRAR